MIRTLLAFVAATALIPVVLLVERISRARARRDRERAEGLMRLGKVVAGWQDRELEAMGWGGGAS